MDGMAVGRVKVVEECDVEKVVMRAREAVGVGVDWDILDDGLIEIMRAVGNGIFDVPWWCFVVLRCAKVMREVLCPFYKQ